MNASIKTYQKEDDKISKALTGLNQGLNKKNAELQTLKSKISELEQKITSVRPTIDAINSILNSFGFTGFKLAEDENQIGNYLIVRNDNKIVQGTLSEGEKTFITFLYFYHLIKGSTDNNLITEDRIVVFDDPISSLDSDVLFIVSNLIRKTIKEVRESETCTIKQLFILTDNTYFHKEVSFNKGKGKDRLKDETSWIVTKNENVSEIKYYESNPIKTSYELLWQEVKEKRDSNCVTILNSLRRIIENYYKIQGQNLENIVEKFQGEEKIVCNSLISWLHDGSHHVIEDLYVDSNPSLVSRYLKVFKRIFEVTGHLAHYKMMTNEE